MKDKLKKIVSILLILGVLAALGLVLGASPVFADGGHGALEVAFSSSPRFPVVGEEAVLTFKISFNDGTPGAGQEVMVMLMKSVAEGHGHEGEVQEAPAAGGHDMAAMDQGKEEEEVPMIHLMPEETSPGVYVVKHTFEHGGRYLATVTVQGDEVDVVVPVRSGPIAWPYIMGLAGISALLAGVVAVVKTVRKEW